MARVTFAPLVRSVSGLLGRASFCRQQGFSVLRSTPAVRSVPTAVQQARRDAWSRLPGLYHPLYWPIRVALTEEAALLNMSTWPAWVSQNLNAELAADKCVPHPYAGTLHPIVNFALSQGPGAETVTATWDADPEDWTSLLLFYIRHKPQGAAHFNPVYDNPATITTIRGFHTYLFYPLLANTEYMISATPMDFTQDNFGRSNVDSAFTAP